MMFFKAIFCYCICFVCAYTSSAQPSNHNHTQTEDEATVRGAIYDANSQTPLEGAEIELLNFLPRKATISSSNGQFLLEEVPFGRQRFLVSKSGYKQLVISDVVVAPGQVAEINIDLEEEAENISSNDSLLLRKMKKVSVANTKDKPFNQMATISTRPFTVEEVTRYAGARLDPARMVTNYSGAFSFDDSRNDIVIRGNSPTHVLWQVEELPVENPNHVTTSGTTGGTDPIINVFAIGKADFMTGPFAAQYGNALSGVFDVQLKRGNSSRFQTMIQLGTQRAGILIESPLGKVGASRRGSFLLSARMSLSNYIFQALPASRFEIPADPETQDFNLKIFIPIGKHNEIDIFAIGGRSRVFIPYDDADFTQRIRYDFFEDEDYDHLCWMGLAGIKFTHYFSNKTYWRSIAGTSINTTTANWHYNELLTDGSRNRIPTYTVNHQRINFMLNSYVNAKIGQRMLLRAGLLANLYTPKLYENYILTGDTYMDFKQPFVLLRGYAQLHYQVAKQWLLDLGFSGQWASLSNQLGADPRVSIRFTPAARHQLTLGYGMHHQLPNFINLFMLNAYNPAYEPNPNPEENQKLKFLRSQQIAFDYDCRIGEDWRFRASLYAQFLSNIPSTVDATSFTPLNGGADFYDVNYMYDYTSNVLESKGKGRNMGLELSLEKFFAKGYYGLLSGTVFDSRQLTSDGIWRNTSFNSRFMVNLLVGREFYLGKNKHTVLFTDMHFSMMGGKPYTPVDIEGSFLANNGYTAHKESEINSAFFKPSYWLHLKLGARFTGKKSRISHTLRLDIFQLLELFGVQNAYAASYSEAYKYPTDMPVLGTTKYSYQRGFIPDLTYFVQF